MIAAQLLGTGGIARPAGRFGDGRARSGGRRPGACPPRRLRFRRLREQRRASRGG